MNYEVWGLHPANLIATVATEREAADLVRSLLEVGWKLENISVSQESDDEPEIGVELPVWEGAALDRLLQSVAREPVDSNR